MSILKININQFIKNIQIDYLTTTGISISYLQTHFSHEK